MTETWRDKLRPASFRGVPFQVKGRTLATGRRGPEHEYPDRDEAFAEDLGRKQRKYDVDAFLLASRLGDEYLSTRDRLLEALEQKGPGEYVDPWGQSWQVQVRSVTWQETMHEGGYVSLKIAFVEYSPQARHRVGTDTGHAVAQAAAAAAPALTDAFAASFDPRGNANVADSALATVGAALDRLDNLLSAVTLTVIGGGPLAVVLARLQATRAAVAGLLASPRALASQMQELMSFSLASLPVGWPRYGAARGLGGGTGAAADTAAAATLGSGGAVIAANRDAVAALVEGIAAIEAAAAAAAIPFEVYDDAVAVREEVAARLDRLMLTASDPVYQRLDRLRAAIVRHITEQGADLSRLADIATTAETPALVLAQRLYGDAGRAADVLGRNPVIRHPGFIPGGVVLKVPTDA